MPDHKITRADVARAAEVAESTVSRALNDSPLITPEIKDRVRRVAEELGYKLNRQASNFARGRSGSIGLVVPRYKSFPPFSRAYFPTLLDGAVLAAQERGVFVTIVLDEESTTAEELAEHVTNRSLDGYLFSVTPATFDRYDHLRDAGVPFVLINNYEEGYFSVDARPKPGMKAACEHCHRLGHRRVGYITGDLKYRNGVDRLNAFKELANEFNVECTVVEGNFSRTSGYHGACKLIAGERPPTVIMTAADRAAIGALAACRDRGLRVPDDISIVGYDDLHPAVDATPQLSTVHNPIGETGRAAATLLLDIVDNQVTEPVQRWLETSFVVRGSTSRARAERPE